MGSCSTSIEAVERSPPGWDCRVLKVSGKKLSRSAAVQKYFANETTQLRDEPAFKRHDKEFGSKSKTWYEVCRLQNVHSPSRILTRVRWHGGRGVGRLAASAAGRFLFKSGSFLLLHRDLPGPSVSHFIFLLYCLFFLLFARRSYQPHLSLSLYSLQTRRHVVGRTFAAAVV